MVAQSSTTSAFNPLQQVRLLGWLCLTPARFVTYQDRVGEDNAKKAVIWLASTLVWLPVLIIVLGKALGLTRPIFQLSLILPSSQNAYDDLSRLSDHPPYGVAYFAWIGIILLAWLLTGLVGTSKNKWVNLATAGLVWIAGVMSIVGFTISNNMFNDISNNILFHTGGVVAGLIAFLVGLGMVGFKANKIANEAGTAMGFSAGIAVVSRIPGLWRYVAVPIVIFLPLGVVFIVGTIFQWSFDSRQATLGSRFILVVLVIAYAVLIWVYLLGG